MIRKSLVLSLILLPIFSSFSSAIEFSNIEILCFDNDQSKTSEQVNNSVPDVDEILKKYIKLVGGPDKLKKIKTVVVSGTWVTDLSYREPQVTVTAFEMLIQAPDTWYIKHTKPDAVHMEGYDGSHGWKQQENGVSAESRHDMVGLFWMFNPWNILNFNKIYPRNCLAGRNYHQDYPVWVIEATDRDDSTISILFDVKTGLIRRSWYADIEEYRDFDGIKFPSSFFFNRKGGYSRLTIDEIKYNIPLDVSEFEPVLKLREDKD